MQSVSSFVRSTVVINLLETLFYVVMLIYACTAKADKSGAKRLAVIGTTLLVFCRATGWLVFTVAARYFFESIYIIQILGQVFYGSIHCLGMAFVVIAVFKGRQPGKPFEESGSADNLSPSQDPNPYATPSA